ncbi:hypothetical protein D3C84_938670 [compost metagenome]
MLEYAIGRCHIEHVAVCECSAAVYDLLAFERLLQNERRTDLMLICAGDAQQMHNRRRDVELAADIMVGAGMAAVRQMDDERYFVEHLLALDLVHRMADQLFERRPVPNRVIVVAIEQEDRIVPYAFFLQLGDKMAK